MQTKKCSSLSILTVWAEFFLINHLISFKPFISKNAETMRSITNILQSLLEMIKAPNLQCYIFIPSGIFLLLWLTNLTQSLPKFSQEWYHWISYERCHEQSYTSYVTPPPVLTFRTISFVWIFYEFTIIKPHEQAWTLVTICKQRHVEWILFMKL